MKYFVVLLCFAVCSSNIGDQSLQTLAEVGRSYASGPLIGVLSGNEFNKDKKNALQILNDFKELISFVDFSPDREKFPSTMMDLFWSKCVEKNLFKKISRFIADDHEVLSLYPRKQYAFRIGPGSKGKKSWLHQKVNGYFF